MFKIIILNRVLAKPFTSRLQITGFKMHVSWSLREWQLFVLRDHGSSECLHDILKCDHAVKDC